MSDMPNKKPLPVTLTLCVDGWLAITGSAGLNTDKDQAAALHISRSTMNRVRNRQSTPGPEFIASALRAFPTARFEDLFTVVAKAVTA